MLIGSKPMIKNISDSCGWEPLQTERKKTKARMMYKLLNKMGPKSLTNLFSF